MIKHIISSLVCKNKDFANTKIRNYTYKKFVLMKTFLAGNIAAATKPVPKDIAAACYDKLPQELREILDRWNSSVESIENPN